MKTTAEKIAVMQAYADGKKIERKSNDSSYDDVWCDVPSPCWDWITYDYRIKPEPKYRPYADADECSADVEKHGVVVKSKIVDKVYTVIRSITGNVIFLGVESFAISMTELLREYVWADDNTPCGVMTE